MLRLTLASFRSLCCCLWEGSGGTAVNSAAHTVAGLPFLLARCWFVFRFLKVITPGRYQSTKTRTGVETSTGRIPLHTNTPGDNYNYNYNYQYVFRPSLYHRGYVEYHTCGSRTANSSTRYHIQTPFLLHRVDTIQPRLAYLVWLATTRTGKETSMEESARHHSSGQKESLTPPRHHLLLHPERRSRRFYLKQIRKPRDLPVDLLQCLSPRQQRLICQLQRPKA